MSLVGLEYHRIRTIKINNHRICLLKTSVEWSTLLGTRDANAWSIGCIHSFAERMRNSRCVKTTAEAPCALMHTCTHTHTHTRAHTHTRCRASGEAHPRVSLVKRPGCENLIDSWTNHSRPFDSPSCESSRQPRSEGREKGGKRD